MRISFSLLLLLSQEGDRSAEIMLQAMKMECGILCDPNFLRIHYHRTHDYFIMHVDQRYVAAPTWTDHKSSSHQVIQQLPVSEWRSRWT